MKSIKKYLLDKGFRYNNRISEENSDCYSIRFPVYKYRKKVVIECELTIEIQTGNKMINVFNCGTNEIYIPYYNHQYGRYPILKTIEQQIDNYINKLNLEKYYDGR